MAASDGMEATLPTFKSSFAYNQLSLPHLLTEYGFEDKVTTKLKKEKETEKEQRKAVRKHKKKTESFDDTEDERALEREKEREEHYMQLVRDMYRLRDYYYNQYSQLLTDKVHKQRRELREREADRQRQREREEEEEKRANHRVKKRLERHTLTSTPHTEDLPKTDLYYIVGLEDKLRREGKLRTTSDYNKFREEIQQPHVFYSQFKVHKSADVDPLHPWIGDHMSTHSQGESLDSVFPLTRSGQLDQPAQQELRSLSRISETQETSRPGTRTENWAVTHQFPPQYKARRSLGGGGHTGRTKVDNQSEIDKRFPKLEMPKLHCFTMDLSEKPPAPDQILQEERLRVREKERKKMMRTVGKMYQLAMSNAAVSNRLLDQHEDMGMIFQGPELCDVIADHHWMRAYGLQPLDVDGQMPASAQLEGHMLLDAEMEGQNLSGMDARGQSSVFEEGDQEMKVKGQTGILPELKSGQSRVSSKADKSQGGSRTSSAESKKSLRAKEEKLSLTMEEVTTKCSTVEAKTLSTLWTNYLRAGK